MNKKFFIDSIPYLIIIITVGAYFFLNSYDNKPFVQMGGFKLPKYPKGTPLLYQMRYLVYLLIIFLIIFNIYYGYETSQLSNISFFEAGKDFLTAYQKRADSIADKKIKEKDPLYKEFDDYRKAFKSEYGSYTTTFCNMFAPCTCCGVGDNKNSAACSSGVLKLP